MKKTIFGLFICLCAAINAQDNYEKNVHSKVISSNFNIFNEQIQKKIAEAEEKLQEYQNRLRDCVQEQNSDLQKKIKKLEKKIRQLKDVLLESETAKDKLS